MKLKEYMVKVHITKKLCINGTTKVGISKMKVDTFFTNFQIQMSIPIHCQPEHNI
ncbi:Hypothetical protein CINCED_3A016770 [Cinara cedri]|uniref:Uncharacterized protein n=1 Tax=Cinara cedri TaxID=506608 RepID=A0A5E4M4I1_9HEMI|nr:Hypothetical protein CINCED_3A016770 [Cinara cedri]